MWSNQNNLSGESSSLSSEGQSSVGLCQTFSSALWGSLG